MEKEKSLFTYYMLAFFKKNCSPSSDFHAGKVKKHINSFIMDTSVSPSSSQEAPDRNTCAYSMCHPICSGGITLLWQNLEYVLLDLTVGWC